MTKKTQIFIEEEKLFIVSMSMILDTDTDYYDQFAAEEKEHFYRQYQELKNSMALLRSDPRQRYSLCHFVYCSRSDKLIE